jgi:hypothetical protein
LGEVMSAPSIASAHGSKPNQSTPAPLGIAIARLAELVQRMVEHLDVYSEPYSEQHLKRKPWSRKEALGHLIDWSVTYQHWLARALIEPKLIVTGHPQDDWVSAQNYRSFSWPDLVDLWVCLNRVLVHVLAQFRDDRINMQCRVGIEEPIALSKLVDRYVKHCEDIAGQILAHL